MRSASGVARRIAGSVVIALSLGASALAQPAAPKADDTHRKEDVARHRQIATAHEAAARCLESGRPESECHEALRRACAGIAVGKYCGMKHSH